jgi:hypothetical protein
MAEQQDEMNPGRAALHAAPRRSRRCCSGSSGASGAGDGLIVGAGPGRAISHPGVFEEDESVSLRIRLGWQPLDNPKDAGNGHE